VKSGLDDRARGKRPQPLPRRDRLERRLGRHTRGENGGDP
jgi:hypothetical protein